MAAPPTTATAPPGQTRRRPWQSVTEFSARTPLRVKLVAALVALVIAALVLITVAGAFEFRGYLHSNADQQISSLFDQSDQQAQQEMQAGQMSIDRPSVICFGAYVEAFVPTGTQLAEAGCPPFESGGYPLPAIPDTTSWLNGHSGHLVTVNSQSGNDTWRVLTKQVQYSTPLGATVPGTLIVGEDLGNINQTIGRLISIDLIVGAIVVLGLAIVGVAVVRASLQPLTEIEQTAGEIAAGDLTRRVTERDPDTEVGSLGRSLNAMLAQIETAFRAQAQSEATARRSEARMRQFAADASHELRTPLTAIKGFAEYYRQRGGGAAVNGEGQRAPEELDRIMNRVENEATRMGGLVEDLLLLARIDQQRPLERLPVDLLALAADAVQDARMIAPDRQIGLTVGHGTAFLVMGDEARLRQVVGNLMSNALNHTPDGTPIEVHVRSGTLHGWGAATVSGPADHLIPAVIFEVVDHGPGMSADQAQRVFERFYRADAARNRATGGTGLGLAIVSALVSAHGGTVFLDTAPGRGATFRVTLPLAPEAQGSGAEEPGGHLDPEDEGQQDWPWPAGQAQPAEAVGPAAFMPQAPPVPDSPAAGPPVPGSPAAGDVWSGGAGQRSAEEQPDVVERRPWRPFS